MTNRTDWQIDVSQLLETADKTWPPTPERVAEVCKRIGTRSKIADKLRLGPYGAKRVSAWISGHNEIPFSVWMALLILDSIQKELTK